MTVLIQPIVEPRPATETQLKAAQKKAAAQVKADEKKSGRED